MASGLAAKINDVFGNTPQLVEGHNGIYEVAVNGRVVATNQGQCSGIRSDEEILREISKHASPLPGKENRVNTVLPMA